MNKGDLRVLQSIVQEQDYSESVLNKAIIEADSLETALCLNALKQRNTNYRVRVVVQSFIYRQANRNTPHMSLKEDY